MRMGSIDALILNYNDAVTAKECALRLAGMNIIQRVLVVDNLSTDDSYAMLAALTCDKIEVVSTSHNGGYGAGNNFGIRYLKEKYDSKQILLCNPDTVIEEDCIAALSEYLSANPDYGIAAPFMLNAKGEKQYNTAFRIPGVNEYILSLGILANRLIKPFYYPDIMQMECDAKDVGAVSGSLFMMDTDKMIQYGMYDESIFLYCEEISLGLKFQKCGVKTALLPGRTFVHNHSVSINKTLMSRVKRHAQLMQSKLYVIRNLYRASPIQNGAAYVLSRISIAECWLLSVLRGQS